MNVSVEREAFWLSKDTDERIEAAAELGIALQPQAPKQIRDVLQTTRFGPYTAREKATMEALAAAIRDLGKTIEAHTSARNVPSL